MAFAVQNTDGTVANANALISVAVFKAYHDDRGQSYAGKTDPDIEKAIIKATDFLFIRFRYKGDIRNQGQTTCFPRRDCIDNRGDLVSGIPQAVVEACAEYALRALNGNLVADPTRDASGRVVQSTSKTVGPLQKYVQYAAGAQFSMPDYPVADNKLRAAGLITGGREVVRA